MPTQAPGSPIGRGRLLGLAAAATAFCGSLWLFIRSVDERSPSPPTAPPGSTDAQVANTATVPLAAPCPPKTLEDGPSDGQTVCIPAPPPHADFAEGAGFIPKLPERPQALSAYQLPAAAPAQLIPIGQSVPNQLWSRSLDLAAQPALSIGCDPGTPLLHRTDPRLGPGGRLSLVALSTDESWVLLAQRLGAPESATDHLFLYAGVSIPPVEAGGEIRSLEAKGPVTLAIRRRRRHGPDAPAPQRSDWDSSRSIGLDPRNVLPLAEAPNNEAPPNTAP